MPKMGEGYLPLLYIPNGAGRYIKCPVLTTTQRDALTAVEGMIIFNSTTGQLEIYDGSYWTAAGEVYADTYSVRLAGSVMTGPLTLGGDLNLNSKGASNVFEFRQAVLTEVIDKPISAKGWTFSTVNTASRPVDNPMGFMLRTGTQANASGLNIVACVGLGLGLTFSQIDYDKPLSYRFRLQRTTADAEAVSYIQIKDVGTIGQLGEKGIGLVIANLALTGEAYGTSRDTVDLSTNLISGDMYDVEIHLTSTGVYFYGNGILKQSITTAGKFPTGDSGANCSLVVSHANGAGAVNSDLIVSMLHIEQGK